MHKFILKYWNLKNSNTFGVDNPSISVSTHSGKRDKKLKEIKMGPKKDLIGVSGAKPLMMFIAILALMAINGLYGQERDTSQVEPKVELKVVYEKTFDEQIVDAIFDTVTVSIEEAKRMGWKDEAFTPEDKVKGKVLVSYPRVVFVAGVGCCGWYIPNNGLEKRIKALRFYSKNGDLQKELEIGKDSIEYIYLSPQKNYILVSKIPWEYAPNHTGGSLYNLEGKKVWEIEGPTPIAVSDEGCAIAVHLDWQIPSEPGGDFYIYDSKGKLITTVENPNKTKTAPLFAKYSENSEYAILGYYTETFSPTIFLLISKTGKILWKRELVEYSYSRAEGAIDLLPNKGIIGYVSRAGMCIFYLDWAGNLKWITNLRTFGYVNCLFASDSKKVYICTAVGYLWCFNREAGEIIWMHKEDGAPPLDSLRPLINTPNFTEMYEQEQNIIIKCEPTTIFLFDTETGKLKAKIVRPGKRIFLSLYNGIIFSINTIDGKVEGLMVKEK